MNELEVIDVSGCLGSIRFIYYYYLRIVIVIVLILEEPALSGSSLG